MSAAYNQQGYGSQQDQSQAQYLQQNYGYPNEGFVPAYQNQSNYGFAPVSEEYLRQPATSPYASAPAYVAEPARVMHMTQTVPVSGASQEPRVIIVQSPPQRDHECDCCTLGECICRCIDWLLTRICYVILTILVLAGLLGLAIWLVKKYKH